MITRRSIRWSTVAYHSWAVMLVMLLYPTVIVALQKKEIFVEIPVAIPTVLGTALSILLGFRTNSAYDRWWEARKIWGAIVNDARNFARQVLSWIAGDEAASLRKEMIYRQIAWCHTLRHTLRGGDPFDDIECLLDQDETDMLRRADHRPNAILLTQTGRLAEAAQRGFVDRILILPIEGTLTRFSDHMGQCERIKTTVFPTQYSLLLSCIIWLFFILLAPSLAPHLGWVAIPVAFLTGMVFVLIEAIGQFLEDPFENTVKDTPMTAICRTIEINLREQLGETELPEKLEPVNGVLM